ncbi:MAG: hypothetical protein ABSF46_07225 [Terriglobia bacterium]|jgi:hypothetical protein
MNPQRPPLSFAGDSSGPLAKQLAGHVQLAQFSGSLATDQQGLLIDGQTATTVGSSAMKQVLESGRLLAISRPTADHTKTLLALTGQAPGANVPLITYKKRADKPGYHCVLVPDGTMKTCTAGESEAAQVSSSPVDVQIGAHLAEALGASAPLGAAPPGLVPPLGSVCGYSSFQAPVSWDPGYPNINGAWDDNTAQQNTQPINNQYLTEFFVYWVNGGNAPYYLVILRETGSMAIGNVLANVGSSRGWFQLMFQIEPNTLSYANSPSSGVQMVAHAPQSGSNSTQLPVMMQVAMVLNANTDQGTGSVPFTATVQDFLNYPSWGIQDKTSGAGSSWLAYQTSGWNPVQYAPANASTWWVAVYANDSTGDVNQMPDQSLGSVQFEALTCWTFSPPLFEPPATAPFLPPPSQGMGFAGGWTQWIGFVHNWAGCHGAAGGEHHHIWGPACGWSWNWGFDLGAVAAQQNIG